ncbi:MAG: hypothetical protein LBH25_15340 [Fibromonadaceae bacterium]|jgi:hypothetical protein|nr:hypothetical protein [Fibromonadaceae bacterium]
MFRDFFNVLAAGARSLSFERRSTTVDFEHEYYRSKVPQRPPVSVRSPRTPAEIMKEAWDDVGYRMREAMGVLEAEHGRRISE